MRSSFASYFESQSEPIFGVGKVSNLRVGRAFSFPKVGARGFLDEQVTTIARDLLVLLNLLHQKPKAGYEADRNT